MSAETIAPGHAETARFDAYGIEPIPGTGRDSTPLEQFWIWTGANIAPINWVLGALGVTLGLTVVETLIVVAVGNLAGCAAFGMFNLMGQRTGVNQMLLGRATFGRHGAALPGLIQGLLAMGWVGVNTWVVLDLVMAILARLGAHGGSGTRYLIGGLIMAAQVGLALLGFYAIRTFEKYTVPLTVVVMVVMTVLALARAHPHWSAAPHPLGAGGKLTAVTQLLTAVGVGWGISWLPYSGDYSRFVRTGTRGRSVFLSTAVGVYLPSVWLAVLGAVLAGSDGGTDPADLVARTFGVMAIPVLLLIMHGPIATNILNLYSCSLAALTIGVRAARWKVTLFAGVIASAVLVVFIRSNSFAGAFDNWMSSILIWISPWAAVVVVDFFVRHRGRPDIAALYRDGDRTYGAFNRPALVSLALGIVAAWSWQYGPVPAMRGPLARLLAHTDFSWLAGIVVAGGLYYTLTRRATPRHRTQPVAGPEPR